MKIFRIFLVSLGFLLLGYLVGQLGFDAVLHHIEEIKWAFPLILIPSCVWHLSNTIAWSFAFPPDAFRPRFPALFMAKLAGEAVNQLTPLANLGGEPLKAHLLRHHTPGARGMASVVIDKTSQLIVGLAFTMVGLGLLFHYQGTSQIFSAQYLAGFVFLLAGSALGLWLFIRRQDRLFTSLLTFLRSVGLRVDLIERNMARAERIDTNIGQFYHEHKSRFGKVLFFQSVGWFMGTCETFIILHVLGANIDFWVCFLLVSLGSVINSLFFFMPSSIGVMEGGQVFLFASLGLDPALGLSLGLIKRMRRILWITIGWLFLSHLSHRTVQRKTAAAALAPSTQS